MRKPVKFNKVTATTPVPTLLKELWHARTVANARVKATGIGVNHKAVEKMLIGLAIFGKIHNPKVYKHTVFAEMILTAGLIAGRRAFVFGTSDLEIEKMSDTDQIAVKVKKVWNRFGVKTGLMTCTKHGFKDVYQLTEEGKIKAKEIEKTLQELTLIKIYQ